MEGNKRSDDLAGKARGIPNEWGDCDAIADVLAGRQLNYSRLLRQIMINCARVFLQFQVEWEAAERLEPYPNTTVVAHIPVSLPYAGE